MKWYWKVRLCNPRGDYAHCEIVTDRNLIEIDVIQDFYRQLTGRRMILGGFQEQSYGLPTPEGAFKHLFKGINE